MGLADETNERLNIFIISVIIVVSTTVLVFTDTLSRTLPTSSSSISLDL